MWVDAPTCSPVDFLQGALELRTRRGRGPEFDRGDAQNRKVDRSSAFPELFFIGQAGLCGAGERPNTSIIGKMSKGVPPKGEFRPKRGAVAPLDRANLSRALQVGVCAGELRLQASARAQVLFQTLGDRDDAPENTGQRKLATSERAKLISMRDVREQPS